MKPSVMLTLFPVCRACIAIVCLLFTGVLQAQVTVNCESATSDPDGDGFGWENGRSCRVVGTQVCQSVDSDPDGDGFGWENGASCRMSNGRPPCQMPGSDPDGDGFGWESGRTCVVKSGTERPTCQQADSDPDGDGFGWENGRSCVVAAKPELSEERYSLPYPACSAERYDPTGSGYGWENSRTCTTRNYGDGGSTITDVVLVTGQSNALGAETVLLDPNSFSEQLDSPVKRVYAYTNTGWTIAGLRQIWDLDWYPRADIAGDPANNFAFHFAKSLVQQDPSKVVGIILVTAPGESISHWDHNEAFYSMLRQKVERALNALPQKTCLLYTSPSPRDGLLSRMPSSA